MSDNGNDAAAIMEPSETYLNANKNIRNMAIDTANSVGAMPISMPEPVAIPFPPLNPANTVHT